MESDFNSDPQQHPPGLIDADVPQLRDNPFVAESLHADLMSDLDRTAIAFDSQTLRAAQAAGILESVLGLNPRYRFLLELNPFGLKSCHDGTPHA